MRSTQGSKHLHYGFDSAINQQDRAARCRTWTNSISLANILYRAQLGRRRRTRADLLISAKAERQASLSECRQTGRMRKTRSTAKRRQYHRKPARPERQTKKSRPLLWARLQPYLGPRWGENGLRWEGEQQASSSGRAREGSRVLPASRRPVGCWISASDQSEARNAGLKRVRSPCRQQRPSRSTSKNRNSTTDKKVRTRRRVAMKFIDCRARMHQSARQMPRQSRAGCPAFHCHFFHRPRPKRRGRGVRV
jgi:hypothetical protein